MSARIRKLPPTRLRAILLAAMGAGVLAGCGTPPAIKPVATPLPGFQRDIQAANNAVAATERQAQSDASSAAEEHPNAGGPDAPAAGHHRDRPRSIRDDPPPPELHGGKPDSSLGGDDREVQ
jgi:hypothetical protein